MEDAKFAEFQKDVIAFFLRKPEVFAMYATQIPIDLFETQACRHIFMVLRELYKQYGSFPTVSECARAVSRLLASVPQLSDNLLLLDFHTELVGELYERETTDETLNQLREEIKQHKITHASQQLATAETLEHLQVVKKAIEEIESLSSDETTIGFRPFLEDITVDSLDVMYEELYGGNPVSTGFKYVDSHIRGEGVRCGDLIVIMGYTGGGKTTIALNMALSMTKQGKRGIYYILDNEPSEIRERVLGILTGEPMCMPDEMHIFCNKVRTSLEDYTGDLILKPLRPNKVSTATLMNHITLVEEFIGKVDFIVVDSGDHVRPMLKHSERHVELEYVFTELKDIGKSTCKDLRVITTTQGNRESLKKIVITLGELSGAYAKAWPASLFMSVNMSPEDKVMGIARLCLLKNTRGKSNMACPIRIDWASMRALDDHTLQSFNYGSFDNNRGKRTNASTYINKGSSGTVGSTMFPTGSMEPWDHLKKEMINSGQDSNNK